MAERRMFAKTIIDSDAFLDMPVSAQCLYFHLAMRADDDGFINSPKKIMKIVNASADDLSILIIRKFILDVGDGIVVIKHWRIHNYLRNDRYKETNYKDKKELLEYDENNAYREKKEVVYQMDTNGIPTVYPGKDRLGKDSIGKDNTLSEMDFSELREMETFSKTLDEKPKKADFIPPTLEQVEAYAEARNRLDLAKKFFDYYNAGNWKDIKGNKVKNWKQKFITWEDKNPKPDKYSTNEMKGEKTDIAKLRKELFGEDEGNN